MGIPVHDSDACVHDLLLPWGAGAKPVEAAFPPEDYPQIYDAKTGAIKRAELGRVVFKDTEKRKTLEAILHPLVERAQQQFIENRAHEDINMVALDIPLLFETGADSRVDYTIVVSAPYHVQRARVLARPGMDEQKFYAIVKEQMPDTEKVERADFVVNTDQGLAETEWELKGIIDKIRKDHE